LRTENIETVELMAAAFLGDKETGDLALRWHDAVPSSAIAWGPRDAVFGTSP